MGKALIIKNADFSNVAVDTIDIDGKTFLTRDNWLYSLNGYFNYSTGLWVTSSTTKSVLWPISAGRFVVVESNPNFTGTTKSIFFTDTKNLALDYACLDSMVGGTKDKSLQIMKCAQDGFVCTTYEDGGIAVPFPTIYITDDVSDLLQVTKENYTLFASAYPTSTGTWSGASTNNDDTLFYPVVKGEKVTVTANSNKSAYIGLIRQAPYHPLVNTNGVLNNSIQALNNAVRNIIEDGSVKRLVIPSGETSQEITIPQNGYLYIWSRDLQDDLYPASVVVSL